MSDRFYLACLRDTVGTNIAFHGKESGYPTDIDRAREYTRAEAQKAWESGREIDLPLCADRIDAIALFHVDCQKLPTERVVLPDCNEYVAFQERGWDGNDVYWLSDGRLPTTDYSLATRYTDPLKGDGIISIPASYADAHKRRTASIELLNRRTMVQAAGLITPDHIKRYQRRKDSGKTRFNCPGCGKVHWQYNPYDFEGCNDVMCIEHRINRPY